MSEFNVQPLQYKLERYKYLSDEIERFDRFLKDRCTEDVLFSLVKHVPDRDMCYPREKEERICLGRTMPASAFQNFIAIHIESLKRELVVITNSLQVATNAMVK